jgi:hypothetical protein
MRQKVEYEHPPQHKDSIFPITNVYPINSLFKCEISAVRLQQKNT